MIQLRHLILSGATVSTVSSVSCKFLQRLLSGILCRFRLCFWRRFSIPTSPPSIESLVIPWRFLGGLLVVTLPIAYPLPTPTTPNLYLLFNLSPPLGRRFLCNLGMQTSEAFADRRSAGRDIGTLQVIFNHVVVRSLSPSSIVAQFETSAGIEGITGKLNKRQSLTSRQKHFHYPDGRIFGCGPKEVYEQQQRDFKRNPRTPAEEAQYQRWTAACREAALITKDPNHPRYAEMVSRHASQLDGQPDPVLGKKRICQFSNFVRAVLIHES